MLIGYARVSTQDQNLYLHDICVQRKGTAVEILNEKDTDELRDLLDYANKFHHETNLAYETEHINDLQLLDFCRRTLRFASTA